MVRTGLFQRAFSVEPKKVIARKGISGRERTKQLILLIATKKVGFSIPKEKEVFKEMFPEAYSEAVFYNRRRESRDLNQWLQDNNLEINYNETK